MKDEQKDSTERFERAVRDSESEVYILRLFVTGMTPNSLRAIENIKRICSDHLGGRYELQVIDIYQKPHVAREEQVLATPTLIKELPEPLRRFIGDLSDEERVLSGLDLVPKEKKDI